MPDIKPSTKQPAVDASQPIGQVLTRSDYGARDASTGQLISVIKTGDDPHCKMNTGVPPRSVPKGSEAQDAE